MSKESRLTALLSGTVRPESVYDHMRAQIGYADPSRICKKHEDFGAYVPARDAFPPNVSVIILTLNEELNLPYALASVSGSQDVVVLDCGSTDKTAEVAKAHGARVLTHTFTTSAEQRQWALDNAEFAYPWVFVLDADEWVPLALAEELSSRLSEFDRDGTAGVWLRNRFVYEGRWIPATSLYPAWTMRLLKQGRVGYEPRSINAHPVADGVEERFAADLVHQDRRSLAMRIRKIDRTARLEALETARLRERSIIEAITGDMPLRRRLKNLFSLFLCMRAQIMGLALILRGGFKEGLAGWHMIQERYMQQWLTVRYVRELEHNAAWRDGPLPDEFQH